MPSVPPGRGVSWGVAVGVVAGAAVVLALAVAVSARTGNPRAEPVTDATRADVPAAHFNSHGTYTSVPRELRAPAAAAA